MSIYSFIGNCSFKVTVMLIVEEFLCYMYYFFLHVDEEPGSEAPSKVGQLFHVLPCSKWF